VGTTNNQQEGDQSKQLLGDYTKGFMISLELQTTFARHFCDICEPTITSVRERDPLLLWEAKICVGNEMEQRTYLVP
jgi:hypothetical protein